MAFKNECSQFIKNIVIDYFSLCVYIFHYWRYT